MTHPILRAFTASVASRFQYFGLRLGLITWRGTCRARTRSRAWTKRGWSASTSPCGKGTCTWYLAGSRSYRSSNPPHRRALVHMRHQEERGNSLPTAPALQSRRPSSACQTLPGDTVPPLASGRIG
eukprot:scaffold172233_cov28-Tisochrysis_lutea.AAC.1